MCVTEATTERQPESLDDQPPPLNNASASNGNTTIPLFTIEILGPGDYRLVVVHTLEDYRHLHPNKYPHTLATLSRSLRCFKSSSGSLILVESLCNLRFGQPDTPIRTTTGGAVPSIPLPVIGRLSTMTTTMYAQSKCPNLNLLFACCREKGPCI